ncbi:hypothetical protein BASA61_009598 [Batrachochytrium salamandrivorans]|nr:hypothetical protein BASA61_009598 [Batrachochytrium salamandrivorans]
MEYFDENWEDLSSYVEEKGQLDIETVRSIAREIINGMLSLKRHGVVHEDLHAKVKLIDFGQFSILPEWEEGKPSR